MQLRSLHGYALVLVASAFSLKAHAKRTELPREGVARVVHIARLISVVQPRLSESRYLEFALGIHRASERYGIDPEVLVSIAQQESGFREKLPEGAAGELGICQIRKNWIQNVKFRKEFPRAKERDLNNASKSFLYAAWILSDLRRSVTAGSLPFWSYYNSVKFENRLKYFLAVNSKISAIKRHGFFKKANLEEEVQPAKRIVRPSRGKLVVQGKDESWIPAALDRLQQRNQVRSSLLSPFVVSEANAAETRRAAQGSLVD